MILLLASINWLLVQQERWDSAQIKPEKQHFVNAIAAQIERNRFRYEAVGKRVNVPWMIVASLHNMEASLSFRTHLHNGDPITAPTRHIPANRPSPWRPPVTWEDSASDALEFNEMGQLDWYGVRKALQHVEKYNGLGHQRFHPDVPTPYLWSWTTVERRGKYVEDGRWSPTAQSQQCGAAAIMKELGYK